MLGDLAMTCGHLLTYVSVQSLRMDLHTIVTLQSVSNHTWRISLFWILNNGKWELTDDECSSSASNCDEAFLCAGVTLEEKRGRDG